MRPRTAALVALALGLAGCNSTGVGNPAPASLTLAITRDDEVVHPVGSTGGGLGEGGAVATEAGGAPTTEGGAPTTEGGATTAAGAGVSEAGAPTSDAASACESDDIALPRAAVENAILVIGKVRFLPCDPRDSESVASGPFLVDLVHGGTSPAIPAVSVPSGGFCGLDVPLAPAEAPSRLAGRSVYFDGTRADGTPFRFYANVQATLRVRARAGLSWGSNLQPTHSVFWALRPRQWLEPGELDALEATKLGDGALAIDVEHHPALLRAIRSRLAGRSTLYDDANDDATFDPADRDDALGDGIPNAD